nr:class I SAM-dependent methyltransferase [Phoenicibacter congonensis]
MEYSKEDLMEAKKQIWGVGENMGTEESKKIWEENAQFWDNAMGDESNEFHREVVRPKVTELLSPNPADYILDIACGNGNYSSYLAQRGASVVAFDYSKKMIELALRASSSSSTAITFMNCLLAYLIREGCESSPACRGWARFSPQASPR